MQIIESCLVGSSRSIDLLTEVPMQGQSCHNQKSIGRVHRHTTNRHSSENHAVGTWILGKDTMPRLRLYYSSVEIMASALELV